jgi:hypothetical protein
MYPLCCRWGAHSGPLYCAAASTALVLDSPFWLSFLTSAFSKLWRNKNDSVGGPIPAPFPTPTSSKLQRNESVGVGGPILAPFQRQRPLNTNATETPTFGAHSGSLSNASVPQALAQSKFGGPLPLSALAFPSLKSVDATAGSTSESRHEQFPFPSLDLSCCCYSLSTS